MSQTRPPPSMKTQIHNPHSQSLNLHLRSLFSLLHRPQTGTKSPTTQVQKEAPAPTGTFPPSLYLHLTTPPTLASLLRPLHPKSTPFHVPNIGFSRPVLLRPLLHHPPPLHQTPRPASHPLHQPMAYLLSLSLPPPPPFTKPPALPRPHSPLSPHLPSLISSSPSTPEFSSATSTPKQQVFSPFPCVKQPRKSAAARNLGLYGPTSRTPTVHFPQLSRSLNRSSAAGTTGRR
ncbi:TBC1 domain family member 30 isoform X1 [Lates japonicus]|uniref:TBC1 domain family member 30 isoform X1 n=1 Tax=Lates japonicus TaxID=270547 RepID=A0AAD3M662_LATJO|nr:TBC1 domain family member 30 isoform X1 [Lates japonicus]